MVPPAVAPSPVAAEQPRRRAQLEELAEDPAILQIGPVLPPGPAAPAPTGPPLRVYVRRRAGAPAHCRAASHPACRTGRGGAPAGARCSVRTSRGGAPVGARCSRTAGSCSSCGSRSATSYFEPTCDAPPDRLAEAC
ncbi:unnamed protein product [Miscanthus lutarioriparius]|uniref:Uncharacterized protein n=1 Tax=Miscanthus lutarioriparius TaxID=422564 RepID=A0A811S0I2_9POAL|nr:unnamed protein product [Miscanthus lutarioriparius]